MLFFYFLSFIFLFSAPYIVAQTGDDYFAETSIKYENYIYKPAIKTAQLFLDGLELADPYIKLGEASDKLRISFDDFGGGFKTYNYTVIHCNSNWEPSQLFPSDYLAGFTEDIFNTYNYSINTFVRYTHYETSFPNNTIKITKTGNYILKVYENYNPDDIVLTYRFLVYDDKVTIVPDFHRPSIIDDRNYKQEIDFTASYNNLKIIDVYNDIKVAIIQNGRWDNAITNLKPNYVNDNNLTYDYDRDNVFSGGNEFRYFDMKTLQLKGVGVNKIEYKDSIQHVYLTEDTRRAYKRYSIQSDINGRFIIRNQNGFTSASDADYVMTHFFLKADKQFKGGDVYLFGQLSNWNISRNYKMKYDETRQQYTLDVLLKQGYYNYEYVFVSDETGKPDESETEGNLFETENDYTILVYVRTMGTNYDQLIGLRKFNTVR